MYQWRTMREFYMYSKSFQARIRTLKEDLYPACSVMCFVKQFSHYYKLKYIRDLKNNSLSFLNLVTLDYLNIGVLSDTIKVGKVKNHSHYNCSVSVYIRIFGLYFFHAWSVHVVLGG